MKKVFVVTAIDHLKAKQLVCKVFATKAEACKFEKKLWLTVHDKVGERYSGVEMFSRAVGE